MSGRQADWVRAAAAMRDLAVHRGDQAYGAVLVIGGVIVGLGPSRVVERSDVDAHAEREAIRDARERLGRRDLAGALLVSTSRPCRRCEIAAAEAGIAQMVFGDPPTSGGAPRA